VVVERIAGAKKALLVGLKSCVCAVPLAQVIETMRPLPVEPIAGVPSFVRGISIIRGIPTPVVDLGTVLGTPSEQPDRFVTLHVCDRQVALAVNAVLGVRDLNAILTTQELPPLLGRASKDVVDTIGTLDEQVLMVLQAGWELPDEVWQALTTQEGAS
jgi:purine-binding chemotaxis protein CheW